MMASFLICISADTWQLTHVCAGAPTTVAVTATWPLTLQPPICQKQYAPPAGDMQAQPGLANLHSIFPLADALKQHQSP